MRPLSITLDVEAMAYGRIPQELPLNRVAVNTYSPPFHPSLASTLRLLSLQSLSRTELRRQRTS